MDCSPTGSHCSHAVSVSENLQQWYGVLDVGQIRVAVEASAEVSPDVEGVDGGICTGGGEAKGSVCLDSAEFIA